MTQKFDPAPFDKHAANPKEAIKVDLVIDEQLKDGMVVRFPLQTPSALRNRHLRSTTLAMNDGNREISLSPKLMNIDRPVRYAGFASAHNLHILVTAMRSIRFCFVAAAAVLATQLPVSAEPLRGDPTSGRQIATVQCSSCHQVLPRLFPERKDLLGADKDGPPSFQSIADLPSTTGLSLNVFLRSNHRNMPNLILSPADSDDLIAYILSLKKQ